MIKLVVLAILLMIVGSLFQGMYYLARDDGRKDQEGLLRALTARIVLSLFLFALLMFSYWMSWIVPPGQDRAPSQPVHENKQP